MGTEKTLWVMDCEPLTNENGEALLLVHNHLDVGDVWSWKSGERFTEDEANFTLPIRVEFERKRGYAGALVDLVDVGVPLMSVRLLDALHHAGVDNLDVYPVELLSKDGSESHRCVAYNVVGLVEGNEAANTPLKLYRLSENVNALIVTDTVRQVVEARCIGPLTFTAPSDWVQI